MAIEVRSDIQVKDDVLVGPFRRPHNLHQQSPGSIHNDEVASKLGFRGGTVAGIIHHEQFAPLMLRAFGQRWFEQGSISLYYKNAATHAEAVQAFARMPEAGVNDALVDIWMDHENGMRVLEGTAGVGQPAAKTYLRQRFEERPAPGQVRILAGIEPGELMPERTVRVSVQEQEGRRAVITEPLDWYWGESPWGGSICTPVTMFRLLNGGLTLRGKIARAVGLYGGIEVRVLNGPLFVDKDYLVQGTILATGETPKSEYLWWESRLRDVATGEPVAEMLMMNRWMKASSELYQ